METSSKKQVIELAKTLIASKEPVSDIVDAFLFVGSRLLGALDLDANQRDNVFYILKDIADGAFSNSRKADSC